MNVAAAPESFAPATAELEVAGVRVVLDPCGVLIAPEYQALVVSDLHLEKGSSFARRGRLVPPYDSDATLQRLELAVAQWRPRLVISLGDSFHDGGGAARLDQRCLERLGAMMAGRDWFWIAGNHDPDAPADLPGDTAQDLALGDLHFRHEPTVGAPAGEIAGHLHPGAVMVRRGRAVRRRCFASDGQRIIMPAFGAYTGMLNILDRAYAGLFRRESLVAHMMGTDGVYPVARRHLR
jgi:uncharacterized protein